jgi:hypothetical protein
LALGARPDEAFRSGATAQGISNGKQKFQPIPGISNRKRWQMKLPTLCRGDFLNPKLTACLSFKNPDFFNPGSFL